jgi:hypothetical protein
MKLNLKLFGVSKMKTVTAEIIETRSRILGKLFTAKVYVPVEGYYSMEKLYFNGNTKTEAKRKAKAALKVLGYTVQFGV